MRVYRIRDKNSGLFLVSHPVPRSSKQRFSEEGIVYGTSEVAMNDAAQFMIAVAQRASGYFLPGKTSPDLEVVEYRLKQERCRYSTEDVRAHAAAVTLEREARHDSEIRKTAPPHQIIMHTSVSDDVYTRRVIDLANAFGRELNGVDENAPPSWYVGENNPKRGEDHE